MRWVLIGLVILHSLSQVTCAESKPTRKIKHPAELLPISKIKELKQKRCAFFHVWATWCVPCIEELPKVLKVLAKLKKVTPVVIDIANPFTQRQFSKKWVEEALAPPFTTYLKPEGDAHEYLEAIDEKWDHSIPFSMVYHGSKKRRSWTGLLDPNELENRISTLCKLPQRDVTSKTKK